MLARGEAWGLLYHGTGLGFLAANAFLVALSSWLPQARRRAGAAEPSAILSGAEKNGAWLLAR